VSNGGTITLPSPVQDGIVMITKVETEPELTGTVDGISEPYISGDESVVFVSDGNEWYSVDRNQLGAIPDSVIDNFNDPLYDDENLTLSDYYNGDLTQYSRQTSTVFEGSAALAGDTSGAAKVIVGNGSLNKTLSQGETAEFYINNGGADLRPAFLYGVQDSSNWYGAFIDAQKQQISLGSDGVIENLAVESASISTSKFYRGEITWNTDDSHSFEVFDPSDGSTVAGPITATDNTHTSGTNGWYNNSSGQSQTAYYDDANVI